jgi:spore coat protein CotH
MFRHAIRLPRTAPLRRVIVWTIGCLLLVTSAPAQTIDGIDAFFDAAALHDIRLSIHSRDLALLRARYDENTFYPADLQWRDVRVRNVAVRSRGFGSRNPVKIGLTIDVDHYTTNQRFLGVASLVLDNLWQDPSMLREYLAMGFLRRLGQAAPREAFARLYINNVYQGLYAVVEDIDAAFVERVTGDTAGTLFEYHWVAPFYGDDLGPLDAYRPMFEPRTRMQDPDSMLWGPIQDLWQAVNDPDDAVWRDQVGRLLDLEQFVTQAAIENYLAENDGLLGYAGMDNFYLYREAGGARHRVFPWDKDTSFLQPDFALLQGAEANRLMRRAIAEPDLLALFLQTLGACATVDAEEAWLATHLERAAAAIAAAAYDDPRKPVSNERFGEALDELRRFAALRAGFVRDRLSVTAW